MWLCAIIKDMKAFVTLLVVGGILLLPVWRGAGHSRHDGVSFPELLYDSTRTLKESPFGHPHLLYEDALSLAREAYLGGV